MEDLSVIQNMDQDILQGMEDNPIGQNRMDMISRAANNPTKTALESESIKTGVEEAVKKLENETRETFTPKEETATTKTTSPDKKAEQPIDMVSKPKRIMGMSPIGFGLVATGVVIAGYFIIKKTIK